MNRSLGNGIVIDGKNCDEDISKILNNMRPKEESLKSVREGEESDVEVGDEGPENLVITNETSKNVDVLRMDDNSSEQSWRLRSLSKSSVASVTTDFPMQNVLLQISWYMHNALVILSAIYFFRGILHSRVIM
ncbi:unnamed protein product [Fraxinus pennsylvanica]|uniref:Uncharacterized protein n=1 Tax=Fraxinus pennsylvanica TaxID=56036 RepID=A0AAD1Z2X2_9LAMI|nr:unnamed protein product [Fraxinus pennsylvanica]